MNRCDCPTEWEEELLRTRLLAESPRDRLLLVLGLETGLRTSELLGLKVGQVWAGSRPATILRVSRRDLKGGRGVGARSVSGRALPLNARARETLIDFFAHTSGRDPGDWLFTGRKGGNRPITRRQAARLIRGVCLRAGLDPHKVWAGHSLRRRFVRRLYDTHGINVARQAVGHRWIATTQIYLGLEEEAAQAAILELAAAPAPQPNLNAAIGV
jgi:site-specific recombinase XerD